MLAKVKSLSGPGRALHWQSYLGIGMDKSFREQKPHKKPNLSKLVD